MTVTPLTPDQRNSILAAAVRNQGRQWHVVSWGWSTATLAKDPRKANTTGDIILTILTFGLWLPILLLNSLGNASKRTKYRTLVIDEYGYLTIS